MKSTKKKVGEQLDELKKHVSRVTDSWGRFVEGMLEPHTIAFFRERGFVPYEAHLHLKVLRNMKNAEYDLLLVAPEQKTLMLVSAKTHVIPQNINQA